MIEDKTEKLFVYGIFLDEYMREAYGMTNPKYDVIPGYITVGGGIVQAEAVGSSHIALTGLLVDMDSERWSRLDMLEGGYDRIKVKTVHGVETFMYAKHSDSLENHSTYQSKWEKKRIRY